MNITLKQLQVFLCITQEKTITAAAKKLFLSKPAVSTGLAELEKQLGHKLFERNNNRLIINEWGKQLLPLADEQLEHYKNIKRLFNEPGSSNVTLRIGSSNTIGNHITPFLLSDFRKKSQHRNQSLLIDNSSIICQKIKEYELDIALIEGYIFDNQLQSIRWLKDEMALVCNRNHPLTKKKRLNWQDLEKQQWILREAGSGTREFFIRNIGEKLCDYHISLELKSTEAIINSSSVGLGITCISKFAARHALNDQRLVELALSSQMQLNMSRDYWLVCRKEKYQSPLLKQFIQFTLDWQQPF
jgi:DNA-binding transcriptional LysR family regulator